MIVLKQAALVVLKTPKTATQSLEAMLKPFSQATPARARGKHINAQTYANRWADRAKQIVGKTPETLAVMREPLEHLQSWYLYRQRPAILGHENSTADISFPAFVEACLMDDPPPFAVQPQSRFLGAEEDQIPKVDYVFDYAHLDLLVTFLSLRLQMPLEMRARNASPPARSQQALRLPGVLLKRLRHERAVDFALYKKVAAGAFLTPKA